MLVFFMRRNKSGLFIPTTAQNTLFKMHHVLRGFGKLSKLSPSRPCAD
uniref:Uncharacterized protein n=1 Tax=Hippocampus comes TaxID=109280 RepID=A0A3Q2YJX5_HIPCM